MNWKTMNDIGSFLIHTIIFCIVVILFCVFTKYIPNAAEIILLSCCCVMLYDNTDI